MSLTATGPGILESDGAPILAGDFWPPVDPAEARATLRLDGTVEPAKLRAVLADAIDATNRALATWQADQEAAGIPTADAVPARPHEAPGALVRAYTRAVIQAAGALLVEHFADFGATGRLEDREGRHMDADTLRRNARWAVADITGEGRTVAELI